MQTTHNAKMAPVLAPVPYRRALLVVKESYFEQVSRTGDTAQLADIMARKPGVESVFESHQQHISTLKHVQDILEARGIAVVVERNFTNLQEVLKDIDLIVTIGGDGTFLRISHEVLRQVPILGVNSAPVTSFGHFCLTNARGFGATLDQLLRGTIPATRLLRLRLTLDGVPLPQLVLNEVLIAHQHPAGTSRYLVSLGQKRAMHKGSGLLVAAPSGTTGFLRSEGGPILPIDDRRFAFQKRAPFLRLFEKPGLLSGIASEGEKLTVISQMQGGKLYIDGEHIEYDFPRGAVLTIEAAREDLIAFVDRGCHTPYVLEHKLNALPIIGRLLSPALGFALGLMRHSALSKRNV